MPTEIFGIIIICYLILTTIGCFIAHTLGRNPFGMFLLSIVITPVAAIGIVFLLGPDYVELNRRNVETHLRSMEARQD